MITATLARQHGIKGPVVVVQVVNATLDTERQRSSGRLGGTRDLRPAPPL